MSERVWSVDRAVAWCENEGVFLDADLVQTEEAFRDILDGHLCDDSALDAAVAAVYGVHETTQ